jgi:hypothetical protein
MRRGSRARSVAEDTQDLADWQHLRPLEGEKTLGSLIGRPIGRRSGMLPGWRRV